jgi:hypothetical protein
MSPRIIAVRHIKDYHLELTFSDGVKGDVDPSDWIVGKGGVYTPLEDVAFFKQVRVEPQFGTIAWPNNVDFCPDVLYSKVTGKPVPFAQHDTPSARKQSA